MGSGGVFGMEMHRLGTVRRFGRYGPTIRIRSADLAAKCRKLAPAKIVASGYDDSRQSAIWISRVLAVRTDSEQAVAADLLRSLFNLKAPA